MSTRLQTQAKAAPALSFTPVRTGILQRACACGEHTHGKGECEACRKHLVGASLQGDRALQRRAAGRAGSSEASNEVPPVVYEVLRSPGAPLDAATRAFFEPRFGHDFSQVPPHAIAGGLSQSKLVIGEPDDRYEQEADRVAKTVTRQREKHSHKPDAAGFPYDLSHVRVHTDAKAAESARAANALAYTVGRDIAFGAGRFAPGTSAGDELLAHELAHVVQQSRMSSPGSIAPAVDSGSQLMLQRHEAGDEVPAAAGYLSEDDLTKQTPSGPATSDSDTDEELGDEEPNVQAKSEGSNVATEFGSTPAASHGRALPNRLRATMERAFGFDFSAVRVHSDAPADHYVTSAQAYAATKGRDIYTRSDITIERHPWLLAHELTHVVQQSQRGRFTGARVQAKSDRRTQQVVSDLEREADAAADNILSGQSANVRAVAMDLPRPQFYQARICDHASTQFKDFPDTYMSAINVDLTSPQHPVTVTWAGPNAAKGETGPFHSSPGAGNCGLNCDDQGTSTTGGSHCTPKVTDSVVHGQACHLGGHPEALNATYFDRSGIALHYYPSVPNYPASHGCVRLGKHASRLIYDNARTGVTTVTVGGTWTRGTKGGKSVCW